MATCGVCHSKKRKIGLMIQNVELLRLRLSQQEKLYYTNLFYDYSENEKVSQKTFPKLLGMLGTDIAENFADRIFETFASNKEFISLYEYLKYIDIYHYGDQDERCKVTCRLMDYDADNKITYSEFSKYINSILEAVRKVNPGVSLDILADKDIKLLFYKISDGKEEFTYADFQKVYREKPELVSWIDYFKNNNTDILVVINDNIRTLLQSIKDFFASFSLNLKMLLQEDKTQIDLSVLTNQIKTFCQTIDKKQKKFLKQIDPFNIRSVFDKLLNNQIEKKNTNVFRKHISSKHVLGNLNVKDTILENQSQNEIPINSNNNNIILTGPSIGKEKELRESKDVNQFFDKFKNNLVEEESENSKEKNEENVTDEDDENNQLNNCGEFDCKGGNISLENAKEFSSPRKALDTDDIVLMSTSHKNIINGTKAPKNDIGTTDSNFYGKMRGNLSNLNIHKSSTSFNRKDNKMLVDMLKMLRQFSETSQNVAKSIDESYRWVKNSYLATHIQKAKIPLKQKTIKRSDNFTMINVPKKIKAPKKQYLIKTTDQSFKILLNMIMGIQIAVQSTPNYDIDPLRDNLSGYLNNLSYSIQTTNFGQKKQESYFIKEYAGIIFNNIRKLIGFSKDSFVASISPQDFITEIMVSSQTIFEELCSTGKSGSLFYYTRDGKFILKTIGEVEYRFLKKILPEYFKHIKSNPYSLLPKFLGCYQLIKKVKKEKSKYYFLIMMNIFATSHEIHVRYDLKGSTIGRRVLKRTIEDNEIISQGNFALKDLDFDDSKRLIIVGDRRDLLIDQLKSDAEFLSKCNINDYSLLFGAHVIARQEKMLTFRSKTQKFFNKKYTRRITQVDKFNFNIDIDRRSDQGKKVKKELSLSQNGSEQSNLDVSLSLNKNSEDNNFDNADFVHVEKHPFRDLDDGGILSEDNQEIYYIGIIDILTEYTCAKHSEHFFKMTYYCSQKMSCVDPLRYKNRFLNYLEAKIVNTENDKEYEEKRP